MKDIPTKTICFFNSNRAWGGGEKWHFTTCKEFQRRGYNSFLVTNVRSELSKKGITERMSVFSFYVNNLSFLNPFKIMTLVALFKSQKVDAVILNLPSDLKLAGIAAKIAGVEKIIYRRGMPHPLRNTWLNRFLFQKILTHVIVNSEEIGRTLSQGNEAWYPHEKMHLVYNGVDTTKTFDTTKKLYQKEGDEVIIGNAGRLTHQKGQKYLIEMAEILRNEGLKFKLFIAGEGELNSELNQLIKQNDLEDEVKLLGHVDDMLAFWNSIDIFVFPSLFEGSANTLIESLQHQKPTIAFNVSSNPEVIHHEENGLLAKAFDVKEFTDLTIRLMKDENLQNKFKDAGLELVKKKFDNAENFKLVERIVRLKQDNLTL